MSADSPVTTAAVNKAAKAVAAVSEVLPTVVETAELAVEVPAKVVLNQRLVVITAAAAGVAVGVGALYGWNWFRTRNKTVVEIPNSRNGDVEDEKTRADETV